MSKNVSRLFLDKLKGKVGQKVDEGQLRELAGHLKKSDLGDEQKMRQLIRRLSAFSGAPVSQAKEDEILKMLSEKKIDPNDLRSLKKWL